MVKTHLAGWKELAAHLNMGMNKLKEHVTKCAEDKTASPFPAVQIDGVGSYRCTISELDAWWKSYSSAKTNNRTPYMKRVKPEE